MTSHPKKSHCKNGHEMIEGNFFINTYGYRRCKICYAARQKIYQKRIRNHGTKPKPVFKDIWPEGCFKGQDVDQVTLVREARLQRYMPMRGLRYTAGGVSQYG